MAEHHNGHSVEAILAEFKGEQGYLLPILHEVQHTFGYVGQEAIEKIAEHVGMTPSQVFGVMTFYADFRTEPPGKNVVSVCDGPACYARGMEKIKRILEHRLGIKGGETTSDGLFTMDWLPCNGTCEHAPMLQINDVIYRKVKPSEVTKILAEWK